MTRSNASVLRRYLYGFVLLMLDIVCSIPSQSLRRWILTGVFRLRLGKGSVIYRKCEFRSPWKIRIGSGTSIGTRVTLDGRGEIEIGDRVNISSEVMMWTAQHDHRDPGFKTNFGKITVHNYSWLGPRVIVLPGVTIGEGSVIAAGAVLTADAVPYGIYAGVPAKQIGERIRGLNYHLGQNYIPFV